MIDNIGDFNIAAGVSACQNEIIKTVYFKHDVPRLYLSTLGDTTFLVNNMDEDEDGYTFLYLPVTPERLESILRGDITL